MWLLDSVSFINVFKGKKSVAHLFDSVSICKPIRSVRDHSDFTVCHKFKLVPAARCVSVANALTSLIKIAFCLMISSFIIKTFVLLL